MISCEIFTLVRRAVAMNFEPCALNLLCRLESAFGGGGGGVCFSYRENMKYVFHITICFFIS